MKRECHLQWYNYFPVILFYSAVIVITFGSLFSLFTNTEMYFIIRLFLFIIYIISLGFTLYYHYKCMTISNIIDYGDDNALIVSEEKDKNFCKICRVNRPKRSHHCKVCGVCNLRMDHHCPWIANCIGEKNEREFIYFLLFCAITCFFVCCLNFNNFFAFLKNNGLLQEINYRDFIKAMTICSFIISLVVGLTTILIGAHYLLYNVKYNITSIEMFIYRNFKECPDYENDLKNNLLRKIRPFPFSFIENYFRETDNINEELNYKNFSEENINLLNEENNMNKI